MHTYPPIADYAVIGDCLTAALVARDGSLDWLCLPRFDSPALFAALLDRERGGRFRIGPVDPAQVTRRYIGASNVLETTFTTATGACRLVDFMNVADEAAKTATLWPDHELVRCLECLGGEMEIEVHFEPRPNYGRDAAGLRSPVGHLLMGQAGVGTYVLQSGVPLTVDPSGARATGRKRLRAGDRLAFAMTYTYGLPAVLPAGGEQAWVSADASVRWWERWVSQLTYGWRYRDHVQRSALVLKLMTYAPSGAIIAAPTTSLPEKIGGVRNWDYRYCWLRDASLTLRALVDAGFGDEAEAFLSWTLHATSLTHPKLQVLYDVYGESHLPELELEHLEGYRGSRPVRIGNDARGQLQLDVYGEVLDAVCLYVRLGGELDNYTRRILRGLADTVCVSWMLPDEGIWEPRSGRRHHTHSKAMCWVALDRLIALHEGGHFRGDVRRYQQIRTAIREEIERRAWRPSLRSYSSVFDEDVLDATLLRMPVTGYIAASDPKMWATIDAVRHALGDHGFLYRYHAHDGLPPGEGAFIICSFWLVEALALAGRLDEAFAEFERLVACANDVGLLSEEIDPATCELLGNFPQAFSHIGLINAAETLAACAGEPQNQPAVRTGYRA